MAYRLQGSILEVCTCKVLCPCWIGEDPDNGTCSAITSPRVGNRTSRRSLSGSGPRPMGALSAQSLAARSVTAGEQLRARGGPEADDLVDPLADDLKVTDPARHHAIPEFQMKAASGEDVAADHAATPGASRDGDSHRRHPLPVEPSAADAVGRVLENPDRIDRVFRRDEHAVPAAQVRLANRPRRSRLLHDRVDRAYEGDQAASFSGAPKELPSLKQPPPSLLSPFCSNVRMTRHLPRPRPTSSHRFPGA